MEGSSATSTIPDQDLRELWSTAQQYLSMRNLLEEVRVGVRGFDSRGTTVRLPYHGAVQLDALDRTLDLAEQLQSVGDLEPRRAFSFQEGLQDWKASHPSCPWRGAPRWVQDAYRFLSEEAMSRSEVDLPAEVENALGFTVGEVHLYWRELMALGMYMHHFIWQGCVDPRTVAPVLARQSFVEDMATEAGIPFAAADKITTLLTMETQRCPDPALTPLIPLGDGLLPLSSLIVPASPHRNTLKILQMDRSNYGKIGDLLGTQGERALRRCLSRLSGRSLVESNVKVLRQNGDDAGDLDVVVCDPKDELLVVFEIYFPLAADGNFEVYRIEERAVEKQKRQQGRLRREIESGNAAVQWPNGWPKVSDFCWRWYVLTRDVLVAQHADDADGTIRSYQMLKNMLRKNASTKELIDLLDNPPTPPCSTHWVRQEFGSLSVIAEMVVPFGSARPAN